MPPCRRRLPPALGALSSPTGTLAAFCVSTLLALLPVLVAEVAAPGSGGAQVVAVVVAVVLQIVTYAVFAWVLSGVIGNAFSCATLTVNFILLVFYWLQLAPASLYFAVWLIDPTAYSSVCDECSPTAGFVRLFYYSATTFVSVGYGDIAPQTVLASVLTIPEFWSPIFFLGILLGKIVQNGGGGGATAVQ